MEIGIKMSKKSRKLALQRGPPPSGGTSRRHLSGPDGRGEGGRGEGTENYPCPGSNTLWADGPANFKFRILWRIGLGK